MFPLTREHRNQYSRRSPSVREGQRETRNPLEHNKEKEMYTTRKLISGPVMLLIALSLDAASTTRVQGQGCQGAIDRAISRKGESAVFIWFTKPLIESDAVVGRRTDQWILRDLITPDPSPSQSQ